MRREISDEALRRLRDRGASDDLIAAVSKAGRRRRLWAAMEQKTTEFHRRLATEAERRLREEGPSESED